MEQGSEVIGQAAADQQLVIVAGEVEGDAILGVFQKTAYELIGRDMHHRIGRSQAHDGVFEAALADAGDARGNEHGADQRARAEAVSADGA